MQKVKLAFHEQYYYSIFIGVIFILLGGLASSLAQPQFNKYHLIHQSENRLSAIAEVIDAPNINTKVQIKLRLKSKIEYGVTEKLNGKIIAYFPSSESSAALDAGDIIHIKAKIYPTEINRNPYSFNFQRFYANQGIYHQGSIIDWQLIEQSNSFYRLLINQREKLLSILAQHLPSENEFAVGATLCLGSKQFLTDELKNEYSSTGAMHVLAVSGLHVGIVFSFIFLLLSTFKTRKSHWLGAKILFTLLCLWMYAFLTGGTASVLRAAVMFSFITVAIYLRWTTNIYNTLSAAAFCLLVNNPNLLFDVGFQLSFTAVAGIVYLQPKIYPWFSFDFKPVDYLWKLSSVGIAAQIATFPIGLYYFHHLPIYFIITGVFVVPFAYMILTTGIILFVLNYVSAFLATWVGYFLYFLIWTNNSLIHLVSEIPGQHIGDIFITSLGIGALYLILYVMDRYMKRGHGTSLLVVYLFFFSSIIYLTHDEDAGYFCIYHTRSEQLIDLAYNGDLVTLKSEAMSNDKANFAADNLRQFHGLSSELVSNNKIVAFKSIYLLGDLKIGVIDKPISLIKNIHLDCLVLSNNADVNIRDLQERVRFDQLVFDSSNSKESIGSWVAECEALEINCHDVNEEGAYYVTF